MAGFLPDGRADPSFGVNGRKTTDEPWQATAIAMHADGRIVVTVGGRELWHALVRFTPLGAVDPTFGEAGRVRRPPPIEQWVHRLAV